jgi:putative ubiquitin-RnfH superfamily antitoxin RatB of RatAB toxin-antitoxin module
MNAPAALRVTVVYCTAHEQHVRELDVAAGATAADAVRLSGIAEAACLSDAELQRMGIFNKSIDAATPLHDGDRVEIYRPLRIDPKDARRRRAAPAKKK